MKEMFKEVGMQILAEALYVAGNQMIKVSNDIKGKQLKPSMKGGIMSPGIAGVGNWNVQDGPEGQGTPV